MRILMQETQVVILLGGLGTRLDRIAPHASKAMVDIYAKPFLYYQLQLLGSIFSLNG
jgi:NDP-sugar pyrophosphorylase family protein